MSAWSAPRWLAAWWLAAALLPLACTVVADGILDDKPGETTSGSGGGAGGAKSVLGNACLMSSECESSNCVDGVCCNTSCSGACIACNVVGEPPGTCSPQPNGTDPEDACADDALCFDGQCQRLNGLACQTDQQCNSGECVDGVCCEEACDGVCEGCSALLTGAADGKCASVLLGTDPHQDCDPVTCSSNNACCGEVQGPLMPGACPAICDVCVGGECVIDCDDATDCPATIDCPPGYDCAVTCVGDNSCKNKTVNCPAERSCDVKCGDSNHRCEDAIINCSVDGPCKVVCEAGDACDGAQVNCGSNLCDVTCIGNNKPDVKCPADSCGCDEACP